jgi:putative spermidine/putrescine transport system permease protein
MSQQMILSSGLRRALTAFTLVGLVVIYVPLALVLLNSFNTDNTFGWPPESLTLRWWKLAWHSEGARNALWTSIKVAIAATAIALALGTLAAMALRRSRFFGRNVVSLLIILPIALPGIVTGLAFQNGFRTILGVPLSLWTIVIAHATFCIVTVFNNVQARFQRLGVNFEQASMDLGAGRWTTFRLVTFPMLRSALLAGALLSFGLSFDEIVVTTFTASSHDQTLPLWIFQNLFRPNQAPIVNVVAAVLVLFSAIPIYIAQRLSGSTAESMTGAR